MPLAGPALNPKIYGAAGVHMATPRHFLNIASAFQTFEQINKLRTEIRHAEILCALLKEKISESALAWLSEANEPTDRIRRAGVFYWEVPEARTADIAAIFFGRATGTNRLCRLMPPGPPIECSEGHFTVPESRSMAADLRNQRRTQCPECRRISMAESDSRTREDQARFDQRVSELRLMPYRHYLDTEEWKSTRRRALRKADFRCQLCDGQGLLNVHHRTYVRRGFEEPADLIVLCEPCHAKFHDKLPKGHS